jgi:hypothetical protein
MNLKEFREQLELFREPPSEDPDPYDRTNHCYLVHNHNGKDHNFQVRGWGKIKDNVLQVSVVNWTLCAGPASLHLTEDIVGLYKITKDYPSN